MSRVSQQPEAEYYKYGEEQYWTVIVMPCQFCGIRQGGTTAYVFLAKGVCYCCWRKPPGEGAKSAADCICCQHAVARGEKNGVMEHLFSPPLRTVT